MSRHVERRQAWLAGRACAEPVGADVCGSTDRLQIMYPAGTTTGVWHLSDARRAAILEQAVVLCWEHFYTHFCARRGVQRAAHGSMAGYRTGCRCGPCVEANSRYRKSRYTRKTNRRSPRRPWETAS